MKRQFLLFILLMGFGITVSAQNLISPESWTAGSGSVGIFEKNGSDAENVREWGTTPFGSRGIIWKSIPDAANDGDGGFSTSHFGIDHTKMYRFTVWIKKTNSNDGRAYLGFNGYNSSGVEQYVIKINSGASLKNPYFYYGDLPSLDKWYLLVGYIHGSGDNSTTDLGGIYDGNTGKKIVAIDDFKFTSAVTRTRHRTYQFYNTNTADKQYFYAPRVDLVSGDEPGIEDLLVVNKEVENSSIKTLDAGWYTIAKNSGNRASAKFSVRETRSSYHSAIHFYAQHHYGTDRSNQLNVLSNSSYGNNLGAFRYLRIVEGSVYDGALLQVYVDAAQTTGCYFEISENIQVTGWQLVDWEPGNLTLPNGAAGIENTKIDLDVNDGMILSHNLWVGNEIEVDGNIISEEIEIKDVTGADFVFDPDYNLMPLAEIEAFVKQNHHLPEVPSAAEMEANGVELGKMNMLLLQKIEELTLHQIEQEKRSENQSEIIALLLLKLEAQNKEIVKLKEITNLK